MIAAISLAATAGAQGLTFPGGRDPAAFDTTAYVDHAGVDWQCGPATYAGHVGTDYGVGGFAGMDAAREVTAAADGVVVAASDGEFDRCVTGACAGGGGYGNFVVLEHRNGRRTLYAHLAQWSVAVAVGDSVVCGQALGQVGSSGASTGPHLHFELRDVADVPVDPYEGPCGASQSAWDDQLGDGEVPGTDCGADPSCEPSGSLSCGQRIVSNNDGAGATSRTWQYGCTDWVYSAPERSWTLSTAGAELVGITVEGLDADLDLYVVDGACDGSGCVAASVGAATAPEAVSFRAVPGRTYLVVVDGWEGAVSDFELAVTCDGEVAPEPPPPTDTSAAVVTDPPDEIGEPASPAGCGCSSGVGHLPGWLLGFAVLRRRRGVR